MPGPREQAGGLAEASRLLQEGMQLLDERTREVDALVQQAHERVRQMTEEAEERARQITADADRQRAELEEQAAALRTEIASLREQLAALRSAPPEPGPEPVSEPNESKTPVIEAPPVPQLESKEVGETANTAPAVTTSAELAEPTPRWGRRSTGAVQAIRTTRSSRPRWLPPWLPFLIVMLAAAAVVATNVDGQTGSRTPFAPDVTTSSSGTSILGFSPIAPTATATSFLLSAPTRTPTPRTVAQSAPSPSASATSSPQPSLNAAAVTAQQTATLPPPGAQIGSPVSLPGEPGPAGPVLAAYTAYSTYTVQPGDTLNQVASQFGVSGDTIVRTSGLQDPNLLQPGQVLTIPRESGWLYRVQPGETLEMIALRFGVMVSDVVSANSLVTSVVHAGDLLFIPSRGTPAPKQ